MRRTEKSRVDVKSPATPGAVLRFFLEWETRYSASLSIT
jgi:hypothetical protein